MAKYIRVFWGSIMTVIGYGGIQGDLDGWIQWLHLGNVDADFWWALLIGLGFLLLIANLVPHNVWLQLYRRLPSVVRRKLRLVNIQSDKITGFYFTRGRLNKLYGGISWEMENSEVIYAAWHGATMAAHLPEERRGKIKRLLLKHPKNCELVPYAEMGNWKPNEVISDIMFATRVFQKSGAEVKWFDAPITSITIGDPDTVNAWARVEVFLFTDSEKWQNYLVYRRDNKEGYDAIKEAFDNMWESKWSTLPEVGE